MARTKYAAEVEDHLSALRVGDDNLTPPERALLEGSVDGADVVQFQCSHGLDALGLLNRGARSVVGLDISPEMIEQARRKADALGRSEARFVVCDVVSPPADLEGAADLVYTGRGSLPWILDLGAWARAVASVLRPGGRLVLYEGHPLANLWDRSASDLRLRVGASYFVSEPEENEGFPRSVVERAADRDGPSPRMLERAWRPGQVVASLIDAGLALERFEEFPDLFWDQFPGWSEDLRAALPNSYGIVARKGDVGDGS